MVWQNGLIAELLLRCCRRHGHVCHLGDRNQFLRPGEVRHWRWKIQKAHGFTVTSRSPSRWRHGDVTVTSRIGDNFESLDLSALVLSGHRSPAVKHGEVMWSPMSPMVWFLMISSVIRTPYRAIQCMIYMSICHMRRKSQETMDGPIDHPKYQKYPKYPKFLVRMVRLVLSCSERKSMAKTAQLVESGQLMFQRFQR